MRVPVPMRHGYVWGEELSEPAIIDRTTTKEALIFRNTQVEDIN